MFDTFKDVQTKKNFWTSEILRNLHLSDGKVKFYKLRKDEINKKK